MAFPFVPKGQEGLLVRNPISLSHDIAHTLEKHSSPLCEAHLNPAKKKVAYFSRHNPHPERVFHIKGLLDTPICCVEDNVSTRMLLSPPSGGGLLGEPYRPPGNTRYGGNKQKSIAAVGIVPVTRAWRNELEAKAKKAIDRVLGKVTTQIPERNETLLSAISDIDDRKVLEWLCRILQTNSITTCQEWLNAASEQEKSIVLNMIKMAAEGDVEFIAPTAPSINEYWYRYSPSMPEPGNPQLSTNDTSVATNLDCNETESTISTPFKLPEHDTVIKSGSQLGKRVIAYSSSRSRTQSADVIDISKCISNTDSSADIKAIAHKRSQSAHYQQQSTLLPKVSLTKSTGLSGKRQLAYKITLQSGAKST